ncbi:hypothetical protein CRG98_002570 [Punica granatum]|uniref:GDSL esterase/lipase At3g48460-like n=1 Tax=Punica granatum TaxID=22663 RepID=A0A2I0L8Q0_PUNGR|nr:hypothetical protein CRG98_002570 [Punica granatum]
MDKASVVLVRLVLLVLTMSVTLSSAHNKSHGGGHRWTTNSTTNIYNTTVNINLDGAFSKVFAFGGSNTDNGNARLMGNLKGFVGAWLHTVEGILAAQSGGAIRGSGSGSAGGGASWSGSGFSSGSNGGSMSGSGSDSASGDASSSVSGSTAGTNSGNISDSVSGSASGGASWSGSGSSAGSIGGSTSGSGSGNVHASGNGLTNGKLVIDHLCDALGIPPVPPYKNRSANFSSGANFALAGSTMLPGSFFLQNNPLSFMSKTVPQSLDLQLQWFQKFLQNFKNGSKPDMDDSLFWLGGVGSNDYARIHKVATFSANWLTQQAIDRVSKLIQKLGELQKMFPHCVFVYADFWKAYMKVLSEYRQFGFTEPFKACCGSGGGNFNFDLRHLCGSPQTSVCSQAAKHMVWDGIHFTAAMHQAVTKIFVHGGCTHPSFEQLIKIKKGLVHR